MHFLNQFKEVKEKLLCVLFLSIELILLLFLLNKNLIKTLEMYQYFFTIHYLKSIYKPCHSDIVSYNILTKND